VPPYGNVAGSLIALNRFDDAAVALMLARTNGINTNGIQRMTYLLGFVRNDPAAMTSAVAAARGTSDAASATSWQARAATGSLRFRSAHELYERAVEEALRDDYREVAGQWAAEAAEAMAIARDCRESRRETDRAL